VTTTDVERFLEEAGSFLVADAVANAVLLTEAGFWSRLGDPVPAATFGWWADAGVTEGAFVHLPDHPVLCSPLGGASVLDLPRVLQDVTWLGVEARNAADVAAAWLHGRGVVLRLGSPIAVLRLQHLREPGGCAGVPRVAGQDDMPLLRSWFSLFRERFPQDPSHVAFVIDQPLDAGSVILWEVDGSPVAMSSRTPPIAGIVRMGLTFQPTKGSRYAEAAFAAGCASAAREAEHVLVLTADPATTAEYEALGFTEVCHRVVLQRRNARLP
jgi:hypothetical protein